MTHPIYNKKLENRPVFAPHTTREMTPEEMISKFGEVFEPARNASGKVIKPPPDTPYKISEKKGTPRAGKDKPKVKMGRKEDPRFMHVTKEFIQAEMAAGKTLHFIGVESGMSKALVYKRAKAFGLYSAKPYVGAKHDK
jgi:hypothetical protein